MTVNQILVVVRNQILFRMIRLQPYHGIQFRFFKFNIEKTLPIDCESVIWQACDSISVGFSKSASALVRTPLKRYQRGAGVGNALMTAVKAAPAAAIAPASATARALHFALIGVRNR